MFSELLSEAIPGVWLLFYKIQGGSHCYVEFHQSNAAYKDHIEWFLASACQIWFRYLIIPEIRGFLIFSMIAELSDVFEYTLAV